MQATTNKRRTQPPLPTLPDHVHQAAIWIDKDGGIAALLIDRTTAQHLLDMPGWRLCQTNVHSCAATYYFEGPEGAIYRLPCHQGWFLFYPEFRTEDTK